MSGYRSTPAGWYQDPTGRVGVHRYFDGTTWTDQTRTVPVAFPPQRPATSAAAPVQVGQPSPAAAPVTAHRPLPTPAHPRPQPNPAAGGSLRELLHAQASQAGWGHRTAHPSGPASAQVSSRVPSPVSARSPFEPAGSPTAGTLPFDAGAGASDPAAPLPAQQPAPTTATPGWYPDPARSGLLRFFDGTGWTARTRRPDDGRKRKLPTAAIALRARMLDIADIQAVRTAGRPARITPIKVTRTARPAPSLNLAVRSRSGAALGMLSMLLVIAGVASALVLSWQLWGSNMYTDWRQSQLSEQLQQQDGYTQFPTSGDPANPANPVDPADPTPVPLPTQPTTTTPATSTPSAPAKSAAKASRPELGSHPADLTPWPPAGWAAPAGRRVPAMPGKEGAPVGRLIIPAIGLDKVFVAGTEEADLRKGPGLWRWGAFPGTPGNTTISGHRTTYGAPFRHLDALRYGDQIILEVPGQPRAVYEVRARVIASPLDVRVTKQAPGVRLTLTSCHPVHSARERIVIEAEMIQGAWLDKTVNRHTWQTLD